MKYFVLYLFLEVLISVNISSAIGGLSTFFEIIFSAFIGVLILTNYKNSLIQNLTAVSYNSIDLQEFQQLNLFTIVGAIFLIIPGFFTDILGVLMQLNILVSMIVNRSNVQSSVQKSNNTKDYDVIDVEIISDNTTTK